MLEQIISETKTMEADAVKAETDAQKAYESFVKDTNASMEEKTRDITNKSEEKATAEADKVATCIEDRIKNRHRIADKCGASRRPPSKSFPDSEVTANVGKDMRKNG